MTGVVQVAVDNGDDDQRRQPDELAGAPDAVRRHGLDRREPAEEEIRSGR